MVDPLSQFDWSTLYKAYDDICKKRFDANTRCLDRFRGASPRTDRELYYCLVKAYAFSTRSNDCDKIGTYQGLLYWKLYSTAGRKGNNILRWLAKGTKGRSTAEVQLDRLVTNLPSALSRDSSSIVGLTRDLPHIQGMGKQSDCRIPVRTTFLHFLYPTVVPIVDKMVLRAVGIDPTKIGYAVLGDYLPFAWQLADRYQSRKKPGGPETPLRAVDMALWVHRGILNESAARVAVASTARPVEQL